MEENLDSLLPTYIHTFIKKIVVACNKTYDDVVVAFSSIAPSCKTLPYMRRGVVVVVIVAIALQAMASQKLSFA
jgi:hypothetical protein